MFNFVTKSGNIRSDKHLVMWDSGIGSPASRPGSQRGQRARSQAVKLLGENEHKGALDTTPPWPGAGGLHHLPSIRVLVSFSRVWFRHVQPTRTLERMVELQTVEQPPLFRRWESLMQGSSPY